MLFHASMFFVLHSAFWLECVFLLAGMCLPSFSFLTDSYMSLETITVSESFHNCSWNSCLLSAFLNFPPLMWAFLVARLVKNPPAVRETWVRFPGVGRPPGEGKDYLLHYSGLKDSMDCTVHGVSKSRTRLSGFHFHFPPLMYHFRDFPGSSVVKTFFNCRGHELRFRMHAVKMLFLMYQFKALISLCFNKWFSSQLD